MLAVIPWHERHIKKLHELAMRNRVDIWFLDECHFQQRRSRETMWIARDVKDPIVFHAPTRKSVGYFGAVRAPSEPTMENWSLCRLILSMPTPLKYFWVDLKITFLMFIYSSPSFLARVTFSGSCHHFLMPRSSATALAARYPEPNITVPPG